MLSLSTNISFAISFDQIAIDHAIAYYVIDPYISAWQSERNTALTQNFLEEVPKQVLKFRTRSDLLKKLSKHVYQRVDSHDPLVMGYAITTDHNTNSANAGIYGKNPMLKYAEEYDFHGQPRFRLVFDANLKTERAAVVKFLEDVVKYGDASASAKTAKAYLNL
mgnify:FL=1